MRTAARFSLVCLLGLGLAPAADAKVYRDGSFSIRAPAGYKLKRTSGGHVLSCGSVRLGFGRFATSRTPAAARDALVRLIGLPVGARDLKRGVARAGMAGTTSGGAIKVAGVTVRRRAGKLEVRALSYIQGQTPCSVGASGRPRARAAALIDELANVLATAGGGGAATLRLKSIEVSDNSPIALTRREVCSNQTQTGQPPCTSALIPDAWGTTFSIAPGTVQAIGLPATGFRGELVLGGLATVYQPTCFNPFGNSNGLPEDGPYSGDTARAVQRVFPQQWAMAARQQGGAALFTPISNVQIAAVLRRPWLAPDPASPNDLYLVTWTQDGKPWSAVFGVAINNAGPDACYWVMYFSFIAVPNDAPPGVATGLAQTWGSWRNSYEPTTRSQRTAVRDLPPAAGNQLTEVAAGRGGVFSPRRSTVRLPDFRSIL